MSPALTRQTFRILSEEMFLFIVLIMGPAFRRIFSEGRYRLVLFAG